MQDPRARAEYERAELEYQQAAANPQRTAGGIRVIPVVVHIIQTSAQEIVTAADVQSQLDVLNEDFRKIAGSPGDGAGVDMQYEFCLASIDPNGCATSGINRVVAPSLAFHEQADAAQMKGLIQWPPLKYLNIWVPRTIETSSGNGQVIGYATFPSQVVLQPSLDGIVIHSGFFGRDADPTTLGRTTTHEVGHWIGLFHTFQGACTGNTANTCVSQGDRVCDTPQAFEQNFGCPTINSCIDSPTDLPDQIENYMDYSDGTCQNMYTAGQKIRADQLVANYRSQIYSAANLTATGCDGTPAPGCVPTANFKVDQRVVCANTPVNFTDLTYGGATGWTWTFAGGTPGTSNVQNPQVIYNTPGTYGVTLTAATGAGSDNEVKTGYVTVVAPTGVPVAESFEASNSLPANWSAYDEDQAGTWTVVNVTGSVGTKCAKVKCFGTFSTGTKDDLDLPPYDFSNVVTSQLTFDYCYRKKSGFTYDSLLVNISTDCGVTWTTLRSRSQATLVTVGGLQSATEFVPTLTTQWKSDTIDLNAYTGFSSIRVRFQVRGYDGQSVYIDNINMNNVNVAAGDPTWNQANLTVSPNPFSQDFEVAYMLQRAGKTRFSLVDATGKELFSHTTGHETPGIHRVNFASSAIAQLPAGIYFLKAQGPDGNMTKKVMRLR